jgi:hypothetical protein
MSYPIGNRFKGEAVLEKLNYAAEELTLEQEDDGVN